ncbi:hypothetical protein ES703_84989 [subsurface metagenome]
MVYLGLNRVDAGSGEFFRYGYADSDIMGCRCNVSRDGNGTLSTPDLIEDTGAHVSQRSPDDGDLSRADVGIL